jgi:hypothetical protein
MSNPNKINRKDLRRLSHLAGFAGVSDLCRSIGITRNTAYEAVTVPAKYPKAFPKIIKALNGQN